MKKKPLLSMLFLVGALSGCASMDQLYADYDLMCEAPQAPFNSVVVVNSMIEEITTRWEPAVYFGFDRGELNDAEKLRLQPNLDIMAANPEYKISMQAFTDQLGNADYNLSLANERLQAVIRYFTENGVSRDRMVTGSAGQEMLLSTDDNVSERVYNRRVELMLLYSNGRPLSLRVVQDADEEAFVAPEPIR